MSGPHGIRLVRGAAALATLIVLAGSPGVPVRAQSPSAPPPPGPTESRPATSAAPVPSAAATPDPLAGIELLVRGEPDPALTVPDADLAALARGNSANGVRAARLPSRAA